LRGFGLGYRVAKDMLRYSVRPFHAMKRQQPYTGTRCHPALRLDRMGIVHVK